jgi:hypothetical protein
MGTRKRRRPSEERQEGIDRDTRIRHHPREKTVVHIRTAWPK